MDVTDGEDIVVLSLSHMVKVKLIGVASPDKTQAYAGVARQHLADLILNKFVVVRYSALRDGYIVGQVLLEKMDVGAQMLRDGVGWYNKSDETLLGDVDRQIYQGSQDAARNERRGLWQDASPVAPWDLHKAQLAAVKPAAPAPAPTYNTTREHLPRLAGSSRRGTAAGLSSEDLMGGVVRPGSIAGRPVVKPISADGASGRWLRYQPADKRFSILAPSDGVEITVPVLDGEGKSMDLHYLVGGVGPNFYYLLWTKGPNGNSTDATTAAEAMKAMLEGINRSTAQSHIQVTATPEGVLNINGYGGRQYSLDAGVATGTVRIVSKQLGDERELFLLCEVNAVGAEPANADFLNSFKIGRGPFRKPEAVLSKSEPVISSQ
ncbi:MAG TPA: thermonuclease family protein [Pyrinomonadaceae bacterium]|jgi:endonuclease YncB( thermonuclease family)|nr:thermonuclease family protein [Pyrinomonadaceae bacterium]